MRYVCEIEDGNSRKLSSPSASVERTIREMKERLGALLKENV